MLPWSRNSEAKVRQKTVTFLGLRLSPTRDFKAVPLWPGCSCPLVVLFINDTLRGHLGEKAHPSHAAVVADRFQAPKGSKRPVACGSESSDNESTIETLIRRLILCDIAFVQDSDPAIFAVTAVALARMGKPGVDHSEHFNVHFIHIVSDFAP